MQPVPVYPIYYTSCSHRPVKLSRCSFCSCREAEQFWNILCLIQGRARRGFFQIGEIERISIQLVNEYVDTPKYKVTLDYVVDILICSKVVTSSLRHIVIASLHFGIWFTGTWDFWRNWCPQKRGQRGEVWKDWDHEPNAMATAADPATKGKSLHFFQTPE